MASKKVLICPLNWGLGHATRDVPIIRLLLKHKFYIIDCCKWRFIGLFKKGISNKLDLSILNLIKLDTQNLNPKYLKMFLLIPSIIILDNKRTFTT